MATKARAGKAQEITSYTEESPEYGTLTFYGPGLTKPEHEIKMQPNVLEASPQAASPETAAETAKPAEPAPENKAEKPAASYGQLMAARQYTDSLGLAGIVDWDGERGVVNIGGTPITPELVSDGIAYVPKAQLDAAVDAYKTRAGLTTPAELYKSYSRVYDTARAEALEKLTGRGEFRYEPEKDPVYQAYRDHYTRAADAALTGTLNANNTSLYGASGAVLSEALAARDAQLRALDDKLPSLYAAAYDRYTAETKRLRDNYSDIQSYANDAWERAKDASDTAWDRARKERQDYYAELQRQAELEETERENERQSRLDELESAARLLDMEGQKSKNRSLFAAAETDEEYAARYPQYLSLQIAAQQLKNRESERELDTDAVLSELARQAYIKSYYAQRGKTDGILGLYRGG